MSRCFLCGHLLDSHNASNTKENGCKRCFPNYGGEVRDASKKYTPLKESTLVGESLTSVHYAKKNIGHKGVRIY